MEQLDSVTMKNVMCGGTVAQCPSDSKVWWKSGTVGQCHKDMKGGESVAGSHSDSKVRFNSGAMSQ